MLMAVVINIVSFLLATYLSIKGENKRLKIVVWIIVFLLTIGNGYVYIKGKKQENLYVDILTPHMLSKEALDMVKLSFSGELGNHDLIDVIGSYYVCLKKPDIFFHRFPEWVFLFRNRNNNEILEFKVSDGRVPRLPGITISELSNLKNGQIANYMNFKVSLEYLGIDSYYKENTIIVILDEEGRSLVIMYLSGSEDSIPEVVESVNTKVFARVRSIGRPTDYVSSMRVIEYPRKFGKIIVRKANFESNEFYNSLDPVTNWEVDIDDAIR